MLVPAINYKEEIEKQFKAIQYTDKYLWYTGSIDNYDIEVKTEGDKFAFAIVCQEHLIGYISFRVDWYCSMAYNFGLIRFSDAFVEIGGVATRTMASAIREVIRMIESFNLHRIDFRCVDGNPARIHYSRISRKIREQGKYDFNLIVFTDNIRDKQGKYHDTSCYELIRRREECR
jgi:hypothetical protein